MDNALPPESVSLRRTARSRRGFARIARERTIDFRAPSPADRVAESPIKFVPAEGSEFGGGALGQAANLPVAPPDDLPSRLLARLQTPLPLLLLPTGPLGWPDPAVWLPARGHPCFDGVGPSAAG